MPVGHGGRGETQLIMALYDELAKPENLDNTDKHIPDWLDDVNQASKEDGEFWVELCAETWAKHIDATK